VARCAGIKRDGGRCTAVVGASQEYCYAHDPARAEERRRNASRAARAKPGRELAGVKAQLEDLTRDVLAGSLETGRAAVANQLINTRLRAIEQERKNRETEDLEVRIEALERTQGQKGARKWGA
jgi:RNA-splicing ligase RtcB